MIAELENVAKAYGKTSILDGLSLQVNEGDRLTVVGPSGSGKSTLLNLLGLLDLPDSGRCEIFEEAVDRMKEKGKARRRAEDIGFIFQLHHLLPQIPVLENATLPAYALDTKPDWAAVESRAHQLLEKVGLKGQEDKLPGQLSGGERQRVSVVRSLINKPRLLLADEPTGSLDQNNAFDLADLLIEMNETEKVTVVVVTHDHEIAEKIGRIHHLEAGKLVAATGN
ncbi:MAG: ATP-binding cassette domain-containing protein [Verrucomicrobiota bacterium]